jgi:hypothetical protein
MNLCTVLALSLLPAFNCFPLGFTEVKKEEVVNTGIDVKGAVSFVFTAFLQ